MKKKSHSEEEFQVHAQQRTLDKQRKKTHVVFSISFHDEFLAQSKANTMKEINFDQSVDLST